MSGIDKISPKKADNLVKEGKGLFIDVRTVGEVLAEQVPGSIFLPFDLVSKERLADLGGQGKLPILVCRSGRRAQQAAEALVQELGDVAVLQGGVVQWKKDGLLLTEDQRVIPLERQVFVGAGSMLLLFNLLGLAVSPVFFALVFMVASGMIFAGITGSCGMARLLVMMPWNKAPLCGPHCSVAETS